MTIEKSFQAGTKILYSNCVDIDSTLLPLIYYKNSMTSTNGNEGILLEIKFKMIDWKVFIWMIYRIEIVDVLESTAVL